MSNRLRFFKENKGISLYFFITLILNLIAPFALSPAFCFIAGLFFGNAIVLFIFSYMEYKR